MNKIIRCYNCGKELFEGDITKEHIPAKTLFDGYDNIFKNNRITVSACLDCNNKYSKIDEEFRNLIGVISRHESNDRLTEKSVTSVLRKGTGFKRLHFGLYNKVEGVEFDYATIEAFHKKNFKGLFYHQYGYPLPDNYEIIVNINEDDNSEGTLSVISYLKNHFEWKHSGHPDIFSYCMQPLRDSISTEGMEDLTLDDDELLIACLMVYNKEHGALVIAVEKSHLELINKRHGK